MADQRERIVLDVDASGAVSALSSTNKQIAALERSFTGAAQSVDQKLLVRIANLKRTMAGDPLRLQELDRLQQKVFSRMQGNVQGFGDTIQKFIAAPLQSVSEAAGAAAKALGPVGTGIMAAGTVAVAAAKGMHDLVIGMGNYAERMLQASVRTGLTTEEVEQFGNAAKLSGMSIDDFETATRGLARTLDVTSTEGKAGREALRQLGVEAYEASGRLRPMGQIWLDLADAVAKIDDPAKRATVAMDLFKRSGVNLLPMLGDLRGNVEKMKALGFGMSRTELESLDKYGDQLEIIDMRISRIWRNMKSWLAQHNAFVLGGNFADWYGTQMEIASGKFQFPTPKNAPAAPAMAYVTSDQYAARRRLNAYGSGGGTEGLKGQITAAEEAYKAAVTKMQALPQYPTLEAANEAIANVEKTRRAWEGLKKTLEGVEAAQKNLEDIQKFQAEMARGEFANKKVQGNLVDLTVAGAKGSIALGDINSGMTRLALGGYTNRREIGLAYGEGIVGQRLAEDEAARRSELAHRIRIVELTAGPGGELAAVNEIFRLRMEGARTEEEMQAARYSREEEILQIQQRRFDEIRSSFESLFDEMISGSRNVWDAMKRTFFSIFLTPVKQQLSMLAAGMFTGRAGGGGAAMAGGGGGLAGVLSGIGGMFGGGGGGFGFPGAPGGTSGFAGPVGGYGGGGAAAGSPWGGFGQMGAGYLANLKGFLGMSGSIATGAGSATTWGAATSMQKLSALGKSNAALLGGGALAFDGLRRGGALGVAETTAGGALIGFKFGGPLGAAIGAGIGFGAGIVRLFIKGATEKLKDKIRTVYGVEVTEKNILTQILDIIKQNYGGNLDMGVRSQPVRELVELYAMSTGKSITAKATMQPYAFSQAGGSMSAVPAGGSYSASSLDGLRGSTQTSGAGGTSVINLQIDSQTVGSVVLQNGRVVSASGLKAMKSNSGRRELTALQISPGLVVA